jgi:hypothetical protein
MFRRISMLLAASLAFVAPAFADYPRIAMIATGGAREYWEPAYQRELASTDLMILSVWPGWGSGRNITMNTAVQRIKAFNPNTKVFLYTLAESLRMPADAAWRPLADQVTANRWWLYQSGTSGTIVPSSFGNGHMGLNISSQSRRNSAGQNFAQWYGTWLVAQFGTPNPAIDGFFMDNVYYAPRVDGDWNGDGTVDLRSNSTVRSWVRQGAVQQVQTMRRAMPNKLFLANAADWGLPDAVLTEFQGQFNGAVFEHMLGRPNSQETWAGWNAMMTGYRKIMAAVAAPKYVICMQGGATTDYQAMRYGLASCTLDDGYYMFSNNSDWFHDVVHFDEYDAHLGNPTSAPPTSAWQSGVYRREFQNGIVLVNPKGNGSRTVNLGGEFVRLSGTQVPAVNNGRVVTSVTLADRDGLFLLRRNRVSAPESPPGFRVD